MRAYKGFREINGKLMCRDMEYQVGETYSHDGKISLCSEGLHYCNEIINVHNYYNLKDNVICEIEILGDFVDGEDKSVTNKLKVLRRLSQHELLKLVNSGKSNVGLFNSGDRNSGDRNSGDWNSGHGNSSDRNSGDWNSGHINSGNENSGHRNSGDRNSGHINSGNENSGHINSGNRNSGDWNKTNGSNGFFNTKPETVKIFNIDSNMTQSEFRISKWYKALTIANIKLTEWIYFTIDEMKEDKTRELSGGYLKTYTYHEACANWWDELSDENKEIIKTIPNFDANIFEEITGINVVE